MDYLLQQAGVNEGHSRRPAIMADLRREIRLLKEQLFTNGRVTRQLVNDMMIEAQLDKFEECPGMVRLRDEMQKKFYAVLSGIDESWLKNFREIEVFFTGGGASLDMVKRLADNQPIKVGQATITPMPVIQPPGWLEEECEDILDFYFQLAVCIGGACRGAGKIPLDVDREFEKFGGGTSGTEWKPGGFRDGQ